MVVCPTWWVGLFAMRKGGLARALVPEFRSAPLEAVVRPRFPAIDIG